MAEGKGFQGGEHGVVEVPGWARDGVEKVDMMH